MSENLDLCRSARVMSLGARYVASDICRSLQDISPIFDLCRSPRHMFAPPDICRPRDMSLKARHVALSEICRSTRDMSLGLLDSTYVARSEICRSGRHMSLGARYVAWREICRLRDMSLGARYVVQDDICRPERHMSPTIIFRIANFKKLNQ